MSQQVPSEIDEVAHILATKVGRNMGGALLSKGEHPLTEGQLDALAPVFSAGFRSAVAAGVALGQAMRPETVAWAIAFVNPQKSAEPNGRS